MAYAVQASSNPHVPSNGASCLSSIWHATDVFVYAAHPHACRSHCLFPILCAMLATQLHLEPGQEPQQLDAATPYSQDHMRERQNHPKPPIAVEGSRAPSPSPAAGPPAATATAHHPKSKAAGARQTMGQLQWPDLRHDRELRQGPTGPPRPMSPLPSLPECTNKTPDKCPDFAQILFHRAARFCAATKLV